MEAYGDVALHFVAGGAVVVFLTEVSEHQSVLSLCRAHVSADMGAARHNVLWLIA